MMKTKKILLVFTALMVLMLPGISSAETILQARPGLNGLYKSSLPVQLNINITNSGPALKDAVLQVKIDPKLSKISTQDYAVYQRQVQVPANGSIETTLTIPGELASDVPVVTLNVGGREIAKTVVQGIAVSGDYVVVSISEKALSGGLPAFIDSNLNSATLKYISSEEIPTDPLALASADLIIVDQEKLAGLTEQQTAAIRQWVALGGSLLLSGGAGAAEDEPFADISPVKVTGASVVTSNWQGKRLSDSPIPVAIGTFVAGENLISEGDIPLVARRTIGRGSVVYSAAGLENLQPKDDAVVWDILTKDTGFFEEKFRSYQAGRINEFVRDSANISQIKLPSVKLMAALWGVYLLVIAPGLYLILKKYRRQGWGWSLIPAIAVLTTLVIYFAAPFHRLNGPIGQTLAFVEIINDEVAEIQTGGSYVSLRGGKLKLQDQGEGIIIPKLDYYGSSAQGKYPVVEYTNAGQTAEFDGVEFWSMRQAAGYKIVNDFGQISGRLTLQGSSVIGALKNETAVDLKRSVAVIGDQVIELGEIPSGETIKVDFNLNELRPFTWDSDIGKLFGESQSDIGYAFWDRYNSTRNHRLQSSTLLNMQLIGYSEQIPQLMSLAVPEANNYTAGIMMQNVPLSLPASGGFKLPPGIVPVQVFEGGLSFTREGYHLHGDRFVLQYDLNLFSAQQKAQITAVELVNFFIGNVHQVSIFDKTTGRWVDLTAEQPQISGESLSRYMGNDNILKIRVYRSDEREILPAPGLAVEGVVK